MRIVDLARATHAEPVRVPIAVSSEQQLRRLSGPELNALRRTLAHALDELPLGSPASQLLGGLNRLARTELARRGSPLLAA